MREQLEKAAATQSLVSAMDGNELKSTLARIAQIMLFDPTANQGQLGRMFRELPVAVAGLIGEELLVLMKDGEYRPEMAAAMLEIADAVLDVYTPADYPFRRSRYVPMP